MSLERTGSIDSGSSWENEYDGGIVNPAGSSYPSQEPVDEITVERTREDDENAVTSAFPSRNEIRFGSTVSLCCTKMAYKIVYKIKNLWGTIQTEDTKNNKDIIIRLTLRELFIYTVFLILLCFVGFGMTSSATYYFTNSIIVTFVDAPVDPLNPTVTFRNIKSSHQWYQFALGPLLDGLYSKTKFGFNFSSLEFDTNYRDLYNKKFKRLKSNETVPSSPKLLLENQLYGLPRLRLLKVRNDSCSVHKDFRLYVNRCYGPYSPQVEDKKKFGPENSTAWFYQSAKELGNTSNSYPGRVSTYGGGGYVQDLNVTYYWSKLAIEELQKFNWLEPGATRAVFVDFTLYNPNVNLFCIVRLLGEFPSSGGVVTSWNLRTVKLLRYSTTMDYVILVFECILAIFLVYYVVEEAIEIRRNGLRYFRSFFNVNDVLVVCLLFSSMVLNIHRSIEVSKIFYSETANDWTGSGIDFNETTDGRSIVESIINETIQNAKYIDLDGIGGLQTTFDVLISVLLFSAWLKLFKFVGFNRTLSQLSLTMGACLGDVLAFTFIFVLVYLSFAQLGYFLFGSVLHDFSTLEGALFAQFRILLGDYELDELVMADRFLGPAYFMLLVFVLFFVLANMFLAIINDAYSDVKIELSRKKSDLELMDYIKRGYQKLLDKLNWRRISRNIEVVDGDAKKNRSYCDDESAAGNVKSGSNGLKNSAGRKERKQQQQFENDSFDDSDEDSSTCDRRAARPGTKGLQRGLGRLRNEGTSSGNRGVGHEEFSLLQRRVDRMEHSIGGVVSKIDAILVKLEGMERLRARRKDTVTRLLDSVTESEGAQDEYRQGRDEMEVWDSYSGVSGPDPSPSSSNNSGRVSHNREQPPNSVGTASEQTASNTPA